MSLISPISPIPHSPERLRLFVAVQVPESVKDAMEKAQVELRRGLPTGCVRWTHREQFHLTLRFLGNVEAQGVELLADALHTVCQGFPPLALRAEGIGFFPEQRSPRVVWVGVHDSEGRLAALQRAVQAATQPFTVEKPEERFAGHITLGRIKGIKRHEAEGMARTAEGMGSRLFGEWTADAIELMRSELAAAGASHTTLQSIPLQLD